MKTYKIVRFFRDSRRNTRIIKKSVSLEEAQRHCQDPSTRKEGEWFDGYQESTYNIVKFYRDPKKKSRVIKKGLTLEEAQRHCQDPKTRGEDWFHGYVEG
jgi:uncharacterized DUF497 family protein